MPTYLLEIPKESDVDLLLPLLKRLKIRFKRTDEGNKTPEDNLLHDQAELDFLMAGLPEKDHFEEWMEEWEENRKDRSLPFRE